MAKFWAKLIATGCFVGFSPVAPGTMGSAVAAIIIWLMAPFQALIYLGIVFLISSVGIWASSEAETIYGVDSHRIVIDEIAGMMVAAYGLTESFALLISCFLIFRLFDILKPFPINRLQGLPRGWGVMADDLMAGLCTRAVMWGYLSLRGG